MGESEMGVSIVAQEGIRRERGRSGEETAIGRLLRVGSRSMLLQRSAVGC